LRLMPRRRHSPGPDRSRGWSVRGIQRRRLRPGHAVLPPGQPA
jgi:hypothetical protein